MSQAVEAILSAESAPPTAQGDGRDKNDSMGLSRIKENKVVSYTFPLYRDGNFRDRGVVKVWPFSLLFCVCLFVYV